MLNFNYLCNNYILNISNLIYGKSLFFLIKNINYKLLYRKKNNKGWIGNLIENYIKLIKINNKYFSDIYPINLEIKTIPVNFNNYPLQDTCIKTININNLFNLLFIKNIIYNISNILWFPIYRKKKSSCLFQIVGKPFITILNKKDCIFYFKDLYKIINFLFLNKEKILCYYSNFFKLQLFFKKKNSKIKFNLINNIYIKIYLRKKITNNFILKSIFY